MISLFLHRDIWAAISVCFTLGEGLSRVGSALSILVTSPRWDTPVISLQFVALRSCFRVCVCESTTLTM